MRNLTRMGAFVSVLGLALLPHSAFAQSFVYPSKGQSAKQQQQDEFECHQWAKQRTGFDPSRPQSASPSPQQQASQHNVLRGAARGAAVGAVGGAIAGDAGKGAAIGAATGGLIGGFRRRDQRRQQQHRQQQYAQQQAAQSQHMRTQFDRALGACLEGRGYTVR